MLVVILMVVVFLSSILAFGRRIFKVKRKLKVYTCNATVLKKEQLHVSDLEFGYPRYRESHEVTFQLDGKTKTFCLSPFEYAVLEEGESGLLTYNRYHLLSFKDKIKLADEEH